MSDDNAAIPFTCNVKIHANRRLAETLEKARMPALGLCPWVHDCGDPYHSIRIRRIHKDV